jgi:hypothetical protein
VATDIKQRRQPIEVVGAGGWDRNEPETVGEVLRLLEARGGRIIDIEEEGGVWRKIVQICQYFGVTGKLSVDPVEILKTLKIEAKDENLTLDEVAEELNKRIEEAIERPELETKTLNSEQLKILLRKLDDHLMEQGKTTEAVERVAKTYGLDKDGEALLAQAVARKKEIEIKLAKHGADVISDSQVVAEAMLVEEGLSKKEAKESAEKMVEVVVEDRTNRPKVREELAGESESVRQVAEELTVALEIEEKLQDATRETVELTRETEAKLRPVLGDRALEVAVAVANGTEPEKAVPTELKIERREREVVIVELGHERETIMVEQQIREKVNIVSTRLAEVLGIERDGVAVEEIRREVEERMRMTMRDGGDLNRPVATVVSGTEGVVVRTTMIGKVEEVVGAEVPTEKLKQVNSILDGASQELNKYQDQFGDVLAWRKRHTREEVIDAMVARSGVSNQSIVDYASRLADIAEKESPIEKWKNVALSNLEAQQMNLAENERLSPTQRENAWDKIVGISKILRMSPDVFDATVAARNKVVEAIGETAVDGVKLGRVGIYDQIFKLAGENEGLKSMLNFVQKKVAFFEQFNNLGFQIFSRLGGEEMALNFAGRIAGQAGVEFAKEGLMIMAEQGAGAGIRFGLEKIAGQLAVRFGINSATTVATSGATTGSIAVAGAATGPPGWVIAAIVIGVQLVGKAVGWVVGKIKGFFGGMLGALGIDAKMFDAVGGIKNFLKENGMGLLNKPMELIEGLLNIIGMGWIAKDLGNLIIWVVSGVFVGFLLISSMLTAPIASLFLPPGRGVGGAVVDQTTLNGGYLAAAPWSGDINELPDSCPPDSLPIGGTVTQGPLAKDCSHALYKNVIDVAGPKDNILSTHDGVVEAVINMGDGYGQYVDIRGRCGTTTFVTRYAHMVVGSPKVKVGEKVEKEKTILGTRNSSGNSSGNHLHYEIRGLTTEYFHDWEGCCNENNGTFCKN